MSVLFILILIKSVIEILIFEEVDLWKGRGALILVKSEGLARNLSGPWSR